MSVTIPPDMDACMVELGGLGALIQASKWKRAAIVAAYVRLDRGNGGRAEPSSSGHFSANEFAGLGIIGLTSATTVAKYVTAWLDTHGGRYPRPGDTVDVPDLAFPPPPEPVPGRARPHRARSTADFDAVVATLRRYSAELCDPSLRSWIVEFTDDERRGQVVEMCARIASTMELVVDDLEGSMPDHRTTVNGVWDESVGTVLASVNE